MNVSTISKRHKQYCHWVTKAPHTHTHRHTAPHRTAQHRTTPQTFRPPESETKQARRFGREDLTNADTQVGTQILGRLKCLLKYRIRRERNEPASKGAEGRERKFPLVPTRNGRGGSWREERDPADRWN